MNPVNPLAGAATRRCRNRWVPRSRSPGLNVADEAAARVAFLWTGAFCQGGGFIGGKRGQKLETNHDPSLTKSHQTPSILTHDRSSAANGEAWASWDNQSSPEMMDRRRGDAFDGKNGAG